MRGMGCALSIHQKECIKSLRCALYVGARYLPENTVLYYHNLLFFILTPVLCIFYYFVQNTTPTGPEDGS
jgi:hypothetical protein